MTQNRSGFISTGKEQLHYQQYGKGNNIIIAFHGYGDTSTIFREFEPMITDQYSIISIDLPHHGSSGWPDDKKLLPEELRSLVTNIKAKFDCSKFSLMGYSMGGRVCMKIIEMFPGDINHVVLLASDGLKPNALYSFVTRNAVGKKMFRSFLTDANAYMSFVKIARSLRLIDHSRYKFAMRYLHDKQERRFLLKVWPCMSLIIPDYKVLTRLINEHQTPVDIFMGYYDKVIPLGLAEQFSKGMDSVHVHVLKRGHKLIDKETIQEVITCLNK